MKYSTEELRRKHEAFLESMDRKTPAEWAQFGRWWDSMVAAVERGEPWTRVEDDAPAGLDTKEALAGYAADMKLYDQLSVWIQQRAEAGFKLLSDPAKSPDERESDTAEFIAKSLDVYDADHPGQVASPRLCVEVAVAIMVLMDKHLAGSPG